jgi:integrase
VLAEIENWKLRSVSTRDDAWVFPSERMTPMAKDNCWRRIMHPALEKAGLGWANFLVMRRTHSSLMKELKADPKLVADQLGHTVDVNLKVYTQSPVESRRVIVKQLQNLLVHKQCSHGVGNEAGFRKFQKRWSGRRGSNPRRPAWEPVRRLKTKNICV